MFHELSDIRALLQGVLLQGRDLQEEVILPNQVRRASVLRHGQAAYSDNHELDSAGDAHHYEFLGQQ